MGWLAAVAPGLVLTTTVYAVPPEATVVTGGVPTVSVCVHTPSISWYGPTVRLVACTEYPPSTNVTVVAFPAALLRNPDPVIVIDEPPAADPDVVPAVPVRLVTTGVTDV